MDVVKCQMANCGMYVSNDEIKLVKFNGNIINICEICDDGSFEEVKKTGESRESFKKNEKIRKTRQSFE